MEYLIILTIVVTSISLIIFIYKYVGYKCPDCKKISRHIVRVETVSNRYKHETVKGEKDRRYKDNPLYCTLRKWFYCANCNIIYSATIVDTITTAGMIQRHMDINSDKDNIDKFENTTTSANGNDDDRLKRLKLNRLEQEIKELKDILKTL